MLSEEQRQAIAERLSGEAQVAPAESPQETKDAPAPESGGSSAAKPPEPPSADKQEQAESPEGKPSDAGAQKSEQYVPVDKFVKLRRERNDLRNEVQAMREQLARFEGYVKATGGRGPSSNRDQDLLDKLLAEVSGKGDDSAQQQEDPVAQRLGQVETYIKEQEARENRQLLDQVVAVCNKHDPTAPRQFPVDRFAEGASPEQALQLWKEWTGTLRSSSQQQQGQVPAKPEGRAAPPPPPTVSRAPQGPSDAKPTGWRDVSTAVRRAVMRG